MRASLQTISQNENNFRKQYSSLSHVKNFLLLLKNFLLLVKKRQIDHKSHKFHEKRKSTSQPIQKPNQTKVREIMPPKEKQTTSSKKRPKMAAAAEEPKISAKKPKADEISAIAKKLEEEEAQYGRIQAPPGSGTLKKVPKSSSILLL